jgi:hypothetical protein
VRWPTWSPISPATAHRRSGVSAVRTPDQKLDLANLR